MNCESILFLLVVTMIVVCTSTVLCIGVHQQSIYYDAFDDVQLQYFLQVNNSASNEEKYQVIQEVCDNSYPLELQYAFYVFPKFSKQSWNCKCKQQLIQHSCS